MAEKSVVSGVGVGGVVVTGVVMEKNIYAGKNGNIHTLNIGALKSPSIIPITVTDAQYIESVEGEVFSGPVSVNINKYGTRFAAC